MKFPLMNGSGIFAKRWFLHDISHNVNNMNSKIEIKSDRDPISRARGKEFNNIILSRAYNTCNVKFLRIDIIL